MARENKLALLETDDVSISTVAVTIKALQVGKKQLTQSVFRQLPEGVLVDEVGVKLLGLPWGWVNYHWGEIAPECSHFLFQQGGRLFRAPYPVRESKFFGTRTTDLCPSMGSSWCPQGFFDHLTDFRREAKALHFARILEGWRPNPNREASYYGDQWFLDYTCDGLPQFRLSARDFFCYSCDKDGFPNLEALNRLLAIPHTHPDRERSRQDGVRATEEALRREVATRCGAALSADQIRGRIAAVKALALDYCRRWDALMEQLRGVEQLFIAC